MSRRKSLDELPNKALPPSKGHHHFDVQQGSHYLVPDPEKGQGHTLIRVCAPLLQIDGLVDFLRNDHGLSGGVQGSIPKEGMAYFEFENNEDNYAKIAATRIRKIPNKLDHVPEKLMDISPVSSGLVREAPPQYREAPKAGKVPFKPEHGLVASFGEPKGDIAPIAHPRGHDSEPRMAKPIAPAQRMERVKPSQPKAPVSNIAPKPFVGHVSIKNGVEKIDFIIPEKRLDALKKALGDIAHTATPQENSGGNVLVIITGEDNFRALAGTGIEFDRKDNRPDIDAFIAGHNLTPRGMGKPR